MNKFLRLVSLVLSALVLASLGHYFAPVSSGEPPLPQVALMLSHGAALLRNECWEDLDGSNRLDTDELKSCPVRIVPPEEWGSHWLT